MIRIYSWECKREAELQCLQQVPCSLVISYPARYIHLLRPLHGAHLQVGQILQVSMKLTCERDEPSGVAMLSCHQWMRRHPSQHVSLIISRHDYLSSCCGRAAMCGTGTATCRLGRLRGATVYEFIPIERPMCPPQEKLSCMLWCQTCNGFVNYFEPPSASFDHLLLCAQHHAVRCTSSQHICKRILEVSLLDQVITFIEQQKNSHSRRSFSRTAHGCWPCAAPLFTAVRKCHH